MSFRQALTPSRLLLHPAWWVALLLLALNDHLLKQSGLLPAVLSGKLSDFAGLFVAPALLASLLALRSRATVAAAHLLTGLVFAAINLSPWAAGGLESVMAWVGIPWRIWTDPSDLMALPVLGLSWFAVHRLSQRPAPASQRARVLRWAACTVGAMFCVATSAAPAPHTRVSGKPDHMRADVFLVNDAAANISVHISMLSDYADFDCDAALARPLSVFKPEMFVREGLWHQQADEAAALWPIAARNERSEERGCGAVIFRVDDSVSILAVWRHTELPLKPVPIVPDRNAYPDGTVLVGKEGSSYTVSAKGPVVLALWP